jgi:hypothetical protein
MSTTLVVNQLKAAIGWDYETVLAYANSANISSFSYSKTLANGTGAGNASKFVLVWCDTSQSAGGGVTSSLAAAAANTYSLQAIADPFGTNLSFSKVRAFYFENTSSGSGTTLTIEPDTTGNNGWQGASALFDAAGTTPQAKLRVRPGGCFIHICTDASGWTVDATHKQFLVNNEDGSNAATYRFVLVGE